jgi:hypothetical protein
LVRWLVVRQPACSPAGRDSDRVEHRSHRIAETRALVHAAKSHEQHALLESAMAIGGPEQ